MPKNNSWNRCASRGQIDLAKKYIDFAKESGADAVKFQSYKAETITKAPQVIGILKWTQ